MRYSLENTSDRTNQVNNLWFGLVTRLGQPDYIDWLVEYKGLNLLSFCFFMRRNLFLPE